MNCLNEEKAYIINQDSGYDYIHILQPAKLDRERRMQGLTA